MSEPKPLNGDDAHTEEEVKKAVRRARLTPLLVTIAAACLFAGVTLTALVVFNLVNELHDARNDIEANRAENHCRADISARLEVVDSEISFNLAKGLAAYAAGDRAEVARRAEAVNDLAEARTEAAEDRANIVELCGNGDAHAEGEEP